MRNAQGLRPHNVIAGQLGAAFMLSDVTDVEIFGCGTPTPAADAPVVHLSNNSGAFIHGCSAKPGTDTFVVVEGIASHDIVLSSNHLGRAAHSVRVASGLRDDVVSC